MQQKGHGRSRQLEASRAYAAKNGLDLAEGDELEDIGISAFKGANARDGALGRFLEAVRSGTVKAGSYLIVESLDRLSREQVLAAQSLFLSIIQAGINLVTLTDSRVYSAGTTDLGDLIVSLVIMSRAHEESQTKSLRMASKWEEKRNAASLLKPMTKWCPAWLELAPDRSSYVPVPERVEIVRQIFTDSANGIGIYRIAHRLNQSKIATFNNSDGWHQSYIAKILVNRAAIGEFQPAVRRDGKRAIDGDPIKGYYPAIIEEELFYRAHNAKSQRQPRGAGRKGVGFSNLFSGIATCAYCGNSITYDNKGSGSKGNRYLVCAHSKRRLGCQGRRWRYDNFEASFLAFVSEIDLASLIGSNDSDHKHQQATLRLSASEGELVEVAGLMEKTYDLLETGAPPEFISSKLRGLQERKDALNQDISELRTQIELLRMRQRNLAQSTSEIRILVRRLRDSNQPDLYELRAKIASYLRSMIETLSIAPQGRQVQLKRIADQTRESFGPEAEEIAAYIENRSTLPEPEMPYFAVGFRDGRVRIVFPDNHDPLKYELQIVAKSGSIFPHRQLPYAGSVE